MARSIEHLSVDLRQAQRRRFPFMAESKVSLNAARVAEALVIALITSMIVYISSVPKLEARLDSLEKGVGEFKVQVSEQVKDVKNEVRDLRGDLYVPAAARQHYPSAGPQVGPGSGSP